MNRHNSQEPCKCGACARAGAVVLVRAHYTARQDARRAQARAALADFAVYVTGIVISMACAAALVLHFLP